MKISTSLIKIRYAVGVMLALSAVFAVVIGTSTLQPRDATAQSKPTLSISMAETQDTGTANVSEGVTGAQFTYYLRVSAALATASQVTVTASGDTGSLNISSQTVTVPANTTGAANHSFTVSFDNTAADSGKREVTLSLPASHDDFTFATGDDAANSVKVTIHDDDNSEATGSPVIRKRQAAGTNNENVVTDNNTYSLGALAISGGEVSVNDILVADLRAIKDNDGLDNAAGLDTVLGAVFGADRVQTTDAGAVLTGSAIDDVSVDYQWVRINGKDDDTLDTDGDGTISSDERGDDPQDVRVGGATGTGTSYTVVAADIGARLKVEVTINDDAHTIVGKEDDDREVLTSSSVGVPATLSISLPDGGDHVAENNTTSGGGVTAPSLVFGVWSDGDVSEALSFKVKVSGGDSRLDLPDSVDVNIPAGQGGPGIGSAFSTYVGFTNSNKSLGKQTVTLTLPTSVAGYRISDTNSVNVTIHDDENSKATGTPVILKLQAAGTTADSNANVVCTDDPNNTPNNPDDDTGCSLNTVAVSNGQVAVGDVLVADLRGIADEDGLVFAKGWNTATNKGDGMLGAVKDNGKVATTNAGAVSDTDDNEVSYTWTRINGVDDDDPDRPSTGDPEDTELGTGISYTVTGGDNIGKKIKVKVEIADDGDGDHGSQGGPISGKADEMLSSATVTVPPTLSITATTDEILESNNIVFTVSSNGNADDDFDVPVSIDTSKAKGVGLNASETVTIAVSNDPDSQETTLPTSNTTAIEGKQTVVVSLEPLDGFYIHPTNNSLTFTVHDTDNTAAIGTPGVLVVQPAGTATDADANVVRDDKDTTATNDDTYSLGTSEVPTGGVSSRTILVADLNGLDDKDGLVDAAGTDKVLGAVFTSGSHKRVQTASNGTVLTGTNGNGITGLDDSVVSYQWKVVVGAKDDDPNKPDNDGADTNLDANNGAQGPAYTVQTADIGKTIYVVATFADDADSQQGGLQTKTPDVNESRISAGVDVMRTLTVTATADVIESSGTFTVTVTSDAAVSADVTVTVSLDLEGPTDVQLSRTVDVTISSGQTSGNKAVTFEPVDDAQGKGTVTASLMTPVTGYLLNSATDTTTIHDNVNSKATNKPEILVVQLAGITGDPDAWVVTDDKGTLDTTDDTYSLRSYSVQPYGAEAGRVLVASLNRVRDNDGLDKAAGADKVLGAVNDNWRVATTNAGVVLTGTNGNGITGLDDSVVTYQWKKVVGVKDDDPDKPANDGADTNLDANNGAEGSAYTVQTADIGETIYVVVTFADDADNGQTPAGPIDKPNESIISAGVDVKRFVQFSGSPPIERVVAENGTIDVRLIVSPGGDLTVNLETDPDTGDLVDNRVPASVEIAASTNLTLHLFAYNAPANVSGTQSFTISIDDDALPAHHVVRPGAGSMTIRVIDGKNSLPPNATLTITNRDGTSPTVGDTLEAELTGLTDPDGLNDPQPVTFTWTVGDSTKKTETVNATKATGSSSLSAISTYVVAHGDEGSISVSISYQDKVGYTNTLPGPTTDNVVPRITDRPDGTAKISRIAPSIRGATVSAGDPVRLSVDVYGLQDVKDAKLGNDVTFSWSVSPSGGKLPASEMGNSEVLLTAPSSPGTYTVTASLPASACYDSTAAVGKETAGCSADFEVRVRRSAPPQEEPTAPVNPPGEIPTILTDSEGEQYDVFTPVEGGKFDADAGYSITAEAGAVPNGEFIGVRISDDGEASNMGMTHQRYTLGGNMYAVHVVDSTGASSSDYRLDDAAEICVPLPDMFRARISDLALVTINSDGSLTILSANVRLGNGGGASVCGNLSGLPATVAVGSVGAPDAIPTPTPVPTPEPPDTGGSAPSSNGMLWVLVLGTAIVLLGAVVAVSARRRGSRSS